MSDEILTSERLLQPETCIMYSDTLKRSEATRFKCGMTFDRYFITNLLLSLVWKNF